MRIEFLMMELIDIGCNLTHESFSSDRVEVLQRAVAAGVSRLVVTGADVASSIQAANLTAEYPSRLWSTAGVHPHHAGNFQHRQRDELLELLRQPRVVAVGECGLDYFRNFSSPAAQRVAFVAQLEIAMTAAKPVFLHQREAHEDFIAILEEFGQQLVGGVAHCFTGDRRQLDSYLAIGLSIGITGWICDERRGAGLRAVVQHIPADRLMLETDAPYLLPRDLAPRPASRRNEPAHLPHIARVVSQLRHESLAALTASTTRNAERLFALAPRAAEIDSTS